MRHPLFLLLLAALALPAPAATPLPCRGQPTSAEAGELLCAIPPSATPRILHFSARFGGVHDDSSASLEAAVEGVAVACGADSQAQLAGEETGDTLRCTLAPPASSQARSLAVRLRWHHAEPAAFELLAD